MNARDELASDLKRIEGYHTTFNHFMSYHREVAADLLAAGYSKPRAVTTREEVEALIEGAVVMDSAGDVSQLRDGVWCGYETSPMAPSRLAKYLPAKVLHEGDDRS